MKCIKPKTFSHVFSALSKSSAYPPHCSISTSPLTIDSTGGILGRASKFGVLAPKASCFWSFAALSRPKASLAYSSLTSEIKHVLQAANVSPEIVSKCYELISEELQQRTEFWSAKLEKARDAKDAVWNDLQEKFNDLQEKSNDLQKKSNDLQEKTELWSVKLQKAQVELGNLTLAKEVALNRTIELMRENNMLHARGILEFAEKSMKAIFMGDTPDRPSLWKGILLERPELAACLEKEAGWSRHSAHKEIDALYRNLNSRMHNLVRPEDSSRRSIHLQLGGGGSGLSSTQVQGLACICRSFYIRYQINDESGVNVYSYEGISDRAIKQQWELLHKGP